MGYSPTPASDLGAAQLRDTGATAQLRETVARFSAASTGRAMWQTVNTLGPLLALLAAMYVGLALHWWPALLLGLPAATLTVRTFVLQHDCGHGSLFRTRRSNDLLGWVCSVFTLTPYSHWRRQHALHHSAWNDLDRRAARGIDIYSSCLTVAEYRALGLWKRRLHRVAMHPVIRLVLLPPLIFFVVFRFPFDAPRSWFRERRDVQLTNIALLVLHGGLALTIGVLPALAGLLAVMVPASIIGVWLFSLQHQFEGTHWVRHPEWSPVAAALHGSSFLRLPRLLQWLSGNIGFHHIHHLAPRVPNYRLADCHAAHPDFATASVLTLADGLRAWRISLWDEATGRLVSFAEASR